MNDITVFEVLVRWNAKGDLKPAREFPEGQFRQARIYADDLFDHGQAYTVQVKQNRYRGRRCVGSVLRMFKTLRGL